MSNEQQHLDSSNFITWASEHLTEEQCEAALSHLVSVHVGEKVYPAFLVRPDFVIALTDHPRNHDLKIMQIQRVAATDDPHVYRFAGGLNWHNPFLQIRTDVFLQGLPESILDVANMPLLDFLLAYGSDWCEVMADNGAEES